MKEKTTTRIALSLVLSVALGLAVFLPLQFVGIDILALGVTLSAAMMGLIVTAAVMLISAISFMVAAKISAGTWKGRQKRSNAQYIKQLDLLTAYVADDLEAEHSFYKLRPGQEYRPAKSPGVMCDKYAINLSAAFSDNPVYEELRAEESDHLVQVYSPLVEQLSKGNPDIPEVLRLISHEDIDVNSRHHNGHSALSIFLAKAQSIPETDSRKILDALLANGADVNQALKIYPPVRGELTSPLLVLIRNLNFQHLPQLLEAGAVVPEYALASLANPFQTLRECSEFNEDIKVYQGILDLLNRGALVTYQLYLRMHSLLVELKIDAPNYYKGKFKRPDQFSAHEAQADTILAVELLRDFCQSKIDEQQHYDKVHSDYLAAIEQCDLQELTDLYKTHGHHCLSRDQIGEPEQGIDEPKQGIIDYLLDQAEGLEVLEFLLRENFFYRNGKADRYAWFCEENISWLFRKEAIPGDILDLLINDLTNFLAGPYNHRDKIKKRIFEGIFVGSNRREILTRMTPSYKHLFYNRFWYFFGGAYQYKDEVDFDAIVSDLKACDLWQEGDTIILNKLISEMKSAKDSLATLDAGDKEIEKLQYKYDICRKLIKAQWSANSYDAKIDFFVSNRWGFYDHFEYIDKYPELIALFFLDSEIVAKLRIDIHEQSRIEARFRHRTVPKWNELFEAAQRYYIDNCVVPVYNQYLNAKPAADIQFEDGVELLDKACHAIWHDTPKPIRKMMLYYAKPDFIDQEIWDDYFSKPVQGRIGEYLPSGGVNSASPQSNPSADDSVALNGPSARTKQAIY